MKIIVEGLKRGIVKMYGENKVMVMETTKNIDVDFVIAVNGEFIDSSIVIENEGEISFDEAERIIKEKILSEDSQ